MLVDLEGEARVHVRDTSTGKILQGDEAPKPDELEVWMETHPGYEVSFLFQHILQRKDNRCQWHFGMRRRSWAAASSADYYTSAFRKYG